MTKLTQIIISSDTRTIPARICGRGTWAEFTQPDHVGHRFIITRHFSDGTESTTHTNREGEGLFFTTRGGSEFQISGTGQFSVNDATAAKARAWFKRRLKKEVEETGAELIFDFDF